MLIWISKEKSGWRCVFRKHQHIDSILSYMLPKIIWEIDIEEEKCSEN